jgi:hypothetical protein
LITPSEPLETKILNWLMKVLPFSRSLANGCLRPWSDPIWLPSGRDKGTGIRQMNAPISPLSKQHRSGNRLRSVR